MSDLLAQVAEAVHAAAAAVLRTPVQVGSMKTPVSASTPISAIRPTHTPILML
jgi:hypothetical protein